MKTQNPELKTYSKTTPMTSTAQNEVVPVGREENAKLVEGLNRLLADEYALFTKTLNYHWNVTGPRFHSIHEFLEGHYRTLLEKIDDVAERVREVGSQPCGTMTEFCDKTHLREKPGVYPEASHMIADLLKDHNSVQAHIRDMLENPSLYQMDPGSEDFLTGLLKEHEEMSWMLKSHLS